MQLHFYTSFIEYLNIRDYGKGDVWLKSKSGPTDIHISVDLDEYDVTARGKRDYIFYVTKK